MLTRLWFVVSILWSALMFWNFSTRENSALHLPEVLFALAPLLAGLACRLVFRYVVTGSLLPPSRPVRG